MSPEENGSCVAFDQNVNRVGQKTKKGFNSREIKYDPTGYMCPTITRSCSCCVVEHNQLLSADLLLFNILWQLKTIATLCHF